MFRIVLFYILFLWPAAFAKTKLIYFGAGGEGQKVDRTQFDGGLSQVGALAAEKKFDAEYYYSLDHKSSLELAKDYTGTTPKNFSGQEWMDRMDLLKADILSGKVKDPVMLMMDTHGTAKSGEFVMSTTDGTVAPKSKLKEVIEAAEQKGVKLAIVMGSCYSGAIVDMGTDKTCVLTTSSQDQYAYGMDFYGFAKAMREEPNLEQAYLKGRSEAVGFWRVPSQPMISSPAGRQTALELGMLNRYITDRERAGLRNRRTVCYPSPKSLLTDVAVQLGEVGERLTVRGFQFVLPPTEIENLRLMAEEYEALREKYRDALRPQLLTNYCFPDVENDKYINCATTKGELDRVSQRFVDLLRRTHLEGNDPAMEQRIRNSLKKIQEHRANSEVYEQTMNMKAKDSGTKEALNRIETLGGRIAEAERKIYDKLYAVKSKELAKQPNPCAEFKLK